VLQVRNVFTGLFLASIGLVISPVFILEHLRLLSVGAAIVLIVKALLISVVVWHFRYSWNTSLAVGFSLAQVRAQITLWTARESCARPCFQRDSEPISVVHTGGRICIRLAEPGQPAALHKQSARDAATRCDGDIAADNASCALSHNSRPKPGWHPAFDVGQRPEAQSERLSAARGWFSLPARCEPDEDSGGCGT
jgi:hypothetical protein